MKKTAEEKTREAVVDKMRHEDEGIVAPGALIDKATVEPGTIVKEKPEGPGSCRPLRIAHFAPFAPYEAGIYEAARDMMRADAEMGHEVAFVDVGLARGNVRQPRRVGSMDARSEFRIVTVTLESVKDFDIFIVHDGSQLLAQFFTAARAKIVKPIHWRPHACFRYQERGLGPAYSFHYTESRNPSFATVSAWFTMWSEFMPYWKVLFPEGKLFCTGDPPIDGDRFGPEGPAHKFSEENNGEFNVVVADSWRDDVDLFHTLHGLIEAGRIVPGLKVHVYGAPEDNEALKLILAELQIMDILGECKPRVDNIAEIFRACDLLVTPHVIATRVMAEAICCGLPVLAGTGCRYETYTCRPDSPAVIAKAIAMIKSDLCHNPYRCDPAPFALEKYGKQMSEIYEKVMNGKEDKEESTVVE